MVSGWGTHVHPWLIHVNVWQKPLHCCNYPPNKIKFFFKKKIYPKNSFLAIAPQTGKLMATMCGSNLVKVEKALNLYNLRERPHSHNFYYSLLLYVHGCSVVYDSFL